MSSSFVTPRSARTCACDPAARMFQRMLVSDFHTLVADEVGDHVVDRTSATSVQTPPESSFSQTLLPLVVLGLALLRIVTVYVCVLSNVIVPVHPGVPALY